MRTKTDIRQEMIARRKALSKELYLAKSQVICERLMAHPKYQQSAVLYCYCSARQEVTLHELIQDAFRQHKKVAFPKVIGEEIFFYQVSGMDMLEEGYFHILEPKTDLPAPPADLMLVPGIAFTKAGARLGYGGGFYDRFLAQNEVYTIGVGYDFQILEHLPLQAHDRMLDEVIWD